MILLSLKRVKISKGFLIRVLKFLYLMLCSNKGCVLKQYLCRHLQLFNQKFCHIVGGRYIPNKNKLLNKVSKT